MVCELLLNLDHVCLSTGIKSLSYAVILVHISRLYASLISTNFIPQGLTKPQTLHLIEQDASIRKWLVVLLPNPLRFIQTLIHLRSIHARSHIFVLSQNLQARDTVH